MRTKTEQTTGGAELAERRSFTQLLEPLPRQVGEDTVCPKLVCFVCTGNTCRSPMAAAVLNALGRGEYQAVSAGLSAVEGDAISEHAVQALHEAGFASTEENPYERYRARSITAEMVAHCDLIVGITARHLLSLVCAFPQAAEKMVCLPRDIADPFLGDLSVYKSCLADITAAVKEYFAL